MLSGPLNALDEAAKVAALGVTRVRQLGLERTYGVALQAIAVNTLFRLGRWREADHFLQLALAAKPTGAAAIDLCLARAKLSVGRGDFEAAEADFAAVEALAGGGLGPRYEAPLLTLRAGLELWRERPERAREAVTRGIMASVSSSDDVWLLAPLIWHGLRAEADIAEVARARQDTVALERATIMAAGLWAQVQSLAEDSQHAAPAIQKAIEAYLLMCQGEAARAEGRADPEVWADAGKRWLDLQQPYPSAYSSWREAGALLAQRSRSSRAAEALRRAHQVAVRLGAVPFRHEVEALAGRARLVLTAAPEVGTDQLEDLAAAQQGAEQAAQEAVLAAAKARYRLSSRELQVWLKLPEGLTNRQIGEQLFISGKTASVHVTNILRKLGVKSRVQAITLAHQLGLVPGREPPGGARDPDGPPR
jgi:DNA-binding CsgD family transcriptional regulator